jgi:ribosomal protein RSM22 (predicted rRNA methylase)
MQLPSYLSDTIDQMVQKMSPKSLKKARESLSETYRAQRTSNSIFQDEAQSLVYLAARFPATYAAAAQVFQRIPLSFSCHHILDLGAGPGTASLAALDFFPSIEKVTLLEKNSNAIALGKQLMAQFSSSKQIEWIPASLPHALPSADLAIFSYALGELETPLKAIEDWQKSDIPFLIVIEPGTPTGFHLIKKVREQLLNGGFHLLAPCPHHLPCPMRPGDWCHFSIRIERSRLHRYLKEASLGYEDEKYSYLVVSRFDPLASPQARILRHVQKNSGHVRLTLCDVDGNWKEKVVTKSNKEFYRKARHSEWGDTF